MLHFNKIRLSPDRKTLTIEAWLEETNYNTQVFPYEIKIQDISTFGTSTYVYNTDLSSYTNEDKEVTINIPVGEILANISNNMLFITITLQGNIDISCPCGKDIMTYTAVFADACTMMNNLSTYTTELNQECSIPKGFINYLLLFKALEYSLKTCNYKDAIKYWNRLNKILRVNISPSNCNCHG